jgi:uncharacterized protein YdaU (DUF1376 family)
MHYYQFNIGDYKSHTEHLSELEDLAYRRMLDWYYLHETPLPGDVDQIARLIRMRSHTDCIAVVLQEYFQETPEGWKNHRADLEIAKAGEKSTKASESAKARWGKRKDANAMRTHSESNATQDTIHITQDTEHKDIKPRKRVDVVCPDSVDQQVWSDFVQHRKAKRSAITQTALEGIQREAAKAGWTLEQALRETVARGWTGFKADWVKVEKKGETFRERDTRLAIERVQAFAPQAAAKQQNTGLVIDVEPLFGRIAK